jgi:hypothetical protein
MISPSVASLAVVVSMVCGLDPLAAQEASRDVAFVEAVTGRVVAFGSGAPALLEPLDVITDRTRVDLLASSELRICHYLTNAVSNGQRSRSDHGFGGRSKRRSGKGNRHLP